MPVIINQVEVTSAPELPVAPGGEPPAAQGPAPESSVGAWVRAVAIRNDRLRAD